ncbi:MAG: 3-deoxy-manno-octulosonate cytidylyltransferase [Deltaproteobacteria bacterium]|nr:MAG: 3-deoxy-manno-octulosonate cytidylyltransferase [Deltaproteobacteria bacterium]
MRAVVIIPARYASTRFPGKPLVPLLGKPMLKWVVEAALKAEGVGEVIVATDDKRIADVASDAGAKPAMTPSDCPTGTDRVALAAATTDAGIVVNLQGDEPALNPENISTLIKVLEDDPEVPLATLSRPLRDPSELWSPDTVKVVSTRLGDALYFSRQPIPYFREAWRGSEGKNPAPEGHITPLAHVGIYAFRRDALFAFTGMSRTPLEEAEELEQLRALESGWRIRVAPSLPPWPAGVDNPEDIKKAEAALRALYGDKVA